MVEFESEEQLGLFISCGSNHSLFIDSKLRAYSWGSTMGGRTGVSLKRLVQKRKKNSTEKKNFDLKYNTKPEIVVSFGVEEMVENIESGP